MRGLSTLRKLLNPARNIPEKWREDWVQSERRKFLRGARIAFSIAALFYLSHLFFVDPHLNLHPTEWWVKYRLTATGISILGLILSFVPTLSQPPFLKAPLIIAAFYYSTSQVEVMNRFAEAPYVYCIAPPLIAGLALRLSSFASAVYLLPIWAAQMLLLEGRSHEIPYITSAWLTCVTALCVFRSNMRTEIYAFILSHEKVENEKKLKHQLKRFLPSEVYGRLERKIQAKGIAPQDAMDSVLKQEWRMTACLYSDIRGFTQKTKKDNNFVINQVVPSNRNIIETTQIYGGVPKQIGDAVFVYFEGEGYRNLLNGVLSGIILSAQEREKVTHTSQGIATINEVKRYFILSYGLCLVGNGGGVNSSVDITAYGNAVNILTRLDRLTKAEIVAGRMKDFPIILSSQGFERLVEACPGIAYEKISFEEIGEEVGDFPEEKFLYLVHSSEENGRVIRDAIELYKESQQGQVEIIPEAS